MRNPLASVENARQVLDLNLNRLLAAEREIYNEKSLSFASCCAKLDALSPLKVLLRGYAAVYSGDKIAGSVSDVDVNKELKIRFHDGVVECKPIKKSING